MTLTGRHDHRNHIHYLETLKGVIKMLRDPAATESVFDIEDGLRDIEATQLAVAHVRKDPAMAAMMKERYLRHETHDIPALLKLPEGSLGYCFAHHIVDNGFDPDYFRTRAVKDDVDYLFMRMRQTHDIWHVITGFGTDPIGNWASRPSRSRRSGDPWQPSSRRGACFGSCSTNLRNWARS